MSFTPNGVKLNKLNESLISQWFFKAGEIVLSILFVIFLAGPIIFPNNLQAAAGVSKILSYQGRLTDSSGNAVANGTYCFRFSIYDAVSAGTKLWPSATPSNSTTTVSGGVFNIGIGDISVGGDSLANYDFSGNDTEYLNIDVYTVAGSTCTGGSWETLAPRQRIDAVAYSRVAENVYGAGLKTSSSTVQVGAGTGSASPVYFNLDWKNTADTLGGTCSVSGAVWYNSNVANRTALVCNNGLIAAFGSGATSSIYAIKEQSTTTPIVNGTVNFSGSNNITISQTGNTLQFSVPSQSVQTQQNIQGIAGSNTTYNTGTVYISGLANITVSSSANGASQYIQLSAPNPGGGAAFSAGTQSVNTGTVNFANSNNISFGMSNSNQITASYIPGPALAVSNIAQTFTSGTVQFSAGNLISLSTGAQAIIVSNLLSSSAIAQPVGTASNAGTLSSRFALADHIHAGVPVAGISGGNTSNTSGTYYGSLMFAGGNNITLSAVTGVGGQTITISGGAGGGGIGGIAVAGSTATNGTILFSNGGNVSFGMNGSTITASAPSGGGGGATFNNFQWPPGQYSTLASSISNAVMTIVPFVLPQNLTATRAMAFLSLSGNTNSSGTYSISIALFTRNGSTLSMASSGSQTYAWASSQTSLVFGPRRMSVPININASPGDYWYGIWLRTSNNGLISIFHGAGANVVFSGNVGLATNSSRQLIVGQGIFSNASFTTAMPGSIAITNVKGGINSATLNRQPWILFSNFDLN